MGSKTVTPLISDITAILDSRTKDHPNLDPARYSYRLPEGLGLDTPVVGSLDINESEMSLWIPLADGNRRDGVGDIVDVHGINTSRHVKNPIVGFDHFKNVHLPIARARKDPKDIGSYTFCIDAVNKTAGCRAYFYQGQNNCGATGTCKVGTHSQFVGELFDMAVKGFVSSGSIGYTVIQGESLPPDYVSGLPQGLHLRKTLLLEGSLVVLPANDSTVGKTNKYLELEEYIIKALSGGKINGSTASPYFHKAFTHYVPQRKAQVISGYQTKSMGTKDHDQESPQGTGTTQGVSGAESTARSTKPTVNEVPTQRGAPQADWVSEDDYSPASVRQGSRGQPVYESAGQYTQPRYSGRLEGYQARQAGSDRLANPYPPGTTEYENWREGWDDQHFLANPETYGKSQKMGLDTIHTKDAGRVPNYRQSEDPKQSCDSCGAFTPHGGQFGQCNMFQVLVDPKAVCDRWYAKTGAKALDIHTKAADDEPEAGGEGAIDTSGLDLFFERTSEGPAFVVVLGPRREKVFSFQRLGSPKKALVAALTQALGRPISGKEADATWNQLKDSIFAEMEKREEPEQPPEDIQQEPEPSEEELQEIEQEEPEEEPEEPEEEVLEEPETSPEPPEQPKIFSPEEEEAPEEEEEAPQEEEVEEPEDKEAAVEEAPREEKKPSPSSNPLTEGITRDETKKEWIAEDGAGNVKIFPDKKYNSTRHALRGAMAFRDGTFAKPDAVERALAEFRRAQSAGEKENPLSGGPYGEYGRADPYELSEEDLELARRATGSKFPAPVPAKRPLPSGDASIPTREAEDIVRPDMKRRVEEMIRRAERGEQVITPSLDMPKPKKPLAALQEEEEDVNPREMGPKLSPTQGKESHKKPVGRTVYGNKPRSGKPTDPERRGHFDRYRAEQAKKPKEAAPQETSTEEKSLHGPQCKCATCQKRYAKKDCGCGGHKAACSCGTIKTKSNGDGGALDGGSPPPAPPPSPPPAAKKPAAKKPAAKKPAAEKPKKEASEKKPAARTPRTRKPKLGEPTSMEDWMTPTAEAVSPEEAREAISQQAQEALAEKRREVAEQEAQEAEELEAQRMNRRRMLGQMGGVLGSGAATLAGVGYGASRAGKKPEGSQAQGAPAQQGTPPRESPRSTPKTRREEEETPQESPPQPNVTEEYGGREPPPPSEDSGALDRLRNRMGRTPTQTPDEGRGLPPQGRVAKETPEENRAREQERGKQAQIAADYGLTLDEVPKFIDFYKWVQRSGRGPHFNSLKKEDQVRAFRANNRGKSMNHFTPNPYEWNAKSLKGLRDKYRKAEGRFFRSKHATPGVIHMNIKAPDLERLRADADGKGVKVQWMGDDGAGTTKVKLSGMDDVLESLAQKYAKAVNKMKSLPKQKVKTRISVTDREEDNPPSNNPIGTLQRDPNVLQSKQKGTTSRQRASVGNMGDNLLNSKLGTEIDPGQPEHTGVLTARGEKAMNKKVTIETKDEDGQNGLQPNPKDSKHRPEDGGVQGEGQGEKTPGEDYSPTERPESDIDQGPKGPYGAQVVRRLHADMAGLLHEYDEFLENLEDEKTRQLVLKQIHHFIASLEELEEHATTHERYKELFKAEPLEGMQMQVKGPELSDPNPLEPEEDPENAIAGMLQGSGMANDNPADALAGMRPQEDEEEMYHKQIKNLRRKHKQYPEMDKEEERYSKHGRRQDKSLALRKHLMFLGNKSDSASKKMRSHLIKLLLKNQKSKDKETLLQGKDKEHIPGHEACEGSEMDVAPGKKGKKSLPSDDADVSPEKARKILEDGEANGKPLTKKQRGFFGAIAGKKD